MSYDSWTCLLVRKGPGILAPSTTQALKFAACDLFLKRHDTRRMRGVCEGVITTTWSTHTVGGQSGILFKAHIEDKKGEYFVNFLLNERDLARGASFVADMESGSIASALTEGHIPCEELYRFENLRGPSRAVH